MLLDGVAYIEWEDGVETYMLPARLPNEIKHGDPVVIGGRRGTFRLLHGNPTKEQIEKAQREWENG